MKKIKKQQQKLVSLSIKGRFTQEYQQRKGSQQRASLFQRAFLSVHCVLQPRKKMQEHSQTLVGLHHTIGCWNRSKGTLGSSGAAYISIQGCTCTDGYSLQGLTQTHAEMLLLGRATGRKERLTERNWDVWEKKIKTLPSLAQGSQAERNQGEKV